MVPFIHFGTASDIVHANSLASCKLVGGELSTIGKSNPDVTNLGINILHQTLLDAYQTIKGFVYRRNPCEIRFTIAETGVVA